MTELKETALIVAVAIVLSLAICDATQQQAAYESGDVYNAVVVSKGRSALACGVVVSINGWERAIAVTPQTYVRLRVGGKIKIAWAGEKPVVLRGTEGDVQRRKAAIETIMEAINR